MTVKELRQILTDIEDQDKEITIGCEGYTSNDIRISEKSEQILITDFCYYEN